MGESSHHTSSLREAMTACLVALGESLGVDYPTVNIEFYHPVLLTSPS
jgi:hypothetical protein